jgi:hypothetical protein
MAELSILSWIEASGGVVLGCALVTLEVSRVRANGKLTAGSYRAAQTSFPRDGYGLAE